MSCPALQEASHLEELRETVQKGQSLLRKKEEKLSQLETSLAEEVTHTRLCEHTPEGARLLSFTSYFVSRFGSTLLKLHNTDINMP